MPITFDGGLKLINLDSDTADAYVIEDIYSYWKEWIESGGGEIFAPAFNSIGGEPLPGGLKSPPYFFLLNDWRIKPREADHNLVLTGNVFIDPDNPNPDATLLAPTTGAFKVEVQYNKTDQSILTQQSIRDAMTIDTSKTIEIGSLDKKVDRVDQNTQPV